MNTVQASRSVEFASGLLDALDRADIRSVSCQLEAADRLNSFEELSTLEGERVDLLNGITAMLRRALVQGPQVADMEEMDITVQLLRHLVRTQQTIS